jgi:tRNA(Ser,Leu) C12 N-acetylase TAN1
MTGLSLLFVVLSSGLALLVRITRRWQKIEDNLDTIASKIADLVRNKEEDHRELAQRIDKVDSRLERHEVWHDEHPYLKN